ncbi:unannotated protein [freshwater metagenome]|uniref:Unannotated protein n=1 Tax=freshwater metagenome TaxID=449393 RepID=A0A6J7KVV9_9ZZZZ
MAMSAPNSPGDLNKVRANKSQSTIASPCFDLTFSIICVKSFTLPVLSGYAIIAANISLLKSSSAKVLSTILIFNGFALV